MSEVKQWSMTAPASYPSEPQIKIHFEPTKLIFILDDSGAGKDADFSFDGSTDHVHLHADHNILEREIDADFRGVWLKGSNSCGVRVMAVRR